MSSSETLTERAMNLAHIDLDPPHRPPSASRLLVATVAALVGSLASDWILVRIGVAIFPATKHFVHFRFADYARLTVIGVVIACLAWPVVARLTSAPRWVFLRCAFLVSAVLLLPDAWLLYKHQPARAVGVLVVLHIAIAIVTYNCLVRIAPIREASVPR